MSNTSKIFNKSLLKKWWFWVVVVVVLGGIGSAFGGENSTNTNTTSNNSNQSQIASFSQRYDSVYDALKSKYEAQSDIFSGSDATTWQANHTNSPTDFPYEYRDVNFDNAKVSYEVKVIADISDASKTYFNDTYTCSEITGSSDGCIVSKIGDDIIYAIFLNDKTDTTTNLQDISSELTATLNAVK